MQHPLEDTSKIIVSRLVQSGRWATDHIIVAKELLTNMSQCCRCHHYMAIKLHTQRTYDMIQWTSLEQCLNHIGFHLGFVSRTLACVSTVRYQVTINGTLIDNFQAKAVCVKGTISPYPYVLYADLNRYAG